MTGGYAASYLSWFLIPFICWLFPVLVLGLVFLHIESDA